MDWSTDKVLVLAPDSGLASAGQVPGLAAMVPRVARSMASGDGWEVRTLEHLGRIHLLLTAADRLGELPGEVAGDVRVAIGYNQPKENVLAGHMGSRTFGPSSDRPLKKMIA